MATSTLTKVTYERILIPTDFSDISDRAVGYAKLIAKQANSQLLLAHVSPPLNPITPPEAVWIDQEAVLQQIEERLEQSGAALRSEGFRAKALSVTGLLQDEILSTVKQENVDLIVLGTHSHKGFERLMFGSDAEAVLRHVSCPVITIGPTVPESTDPSWPPTNIVCASTLRPDSARIAAYAYAFARYYEAKFVLFHVVEHPGRRQTLDWEPFAHAFREYIPEGIEEPSPLQTLLTNTPPGISIVDFAKQHGSDLIVMGARTASAMATHFARGTTGNVFAEASCPVMTLHEP